MNAISIASFSFAILIILLSVLTTLEDPMQMLDWHGLMIVVGGTIASAAVSFKINTVITLLKIFFHRALGGGGVDFRSLIHELLHIADLYRSQPAKLKEHLKTVDDHFLREALEGLVDEIVGIEEHLNILEKKSATIYARYVEEATRFKALGKYPPAMGLMGAVLGMIALLAGLGSPGAEKNVGPAMSVALIATFYGIAIANLMIIPIGENLAEAAKEVRTKNTVIIESLKLIHAKKNPTILLEEMNAYLLPKDRISRDEMKKKAA